MTRWPPVMASAQSRAPIAPPRQRRIIGAGGVWVTECDLPHHGRPTCIVRPWSACLGSRPAAPVSATHSNPGHRTRGGPTARETWRGAQGVRAPPCRLIADWTGSILVRPVRCDSGLTVERLGTSVRANGSASRTPPTVRGASTFGAIGSSAVHKGAIDNGARPIHTYFKTCLIA